jgi:hypothetical protein
MFLVDTLTCIVTPTTIALSQRRKVHNEVRFSCRSLTCLPKLGEVSLSTVHHQEKIHNEMKGAHGQSTYIHERSRFYGSGKFYEFSEATKHRPPSGATDGIMAIDQESAPVPRRNATMETQFRTTLPRARTPSFPSRRTVKRRISTSLRPLAQAILLSV